MGFWKKVVKNQEKTERISGFFLFPSHEATTLTLFCIQKTPEHRPSVFIVFLIALSRVSINSIKAVALYRFVLFRASEHHYQRQQYATDCVAHNGQQDISNNVPRYFTQKVEVHHIRN